jgi:FKBP-type peptidyl-prolyl cis-trans isomerase
MDKSKLAAIGLLIILGGGMYMAQNASAPVVQHDHNNDGKPDHDDAGHTEENSGTGSETKEAVPHDHDGDGKPDHDDSAHAEPQAAVPHDHDGDGKPDHDDSAHAPAGSSTDLAGGVKELKIEDQRKGTGATAENGNKLTMNYKGQLLNGKVFDQSYGRGPFSFTLGGGEVIQGWDKGILGMKVGGKRKLTIPANLGYGDRGAGADIPPGATLVFEVELIEVQK